MKSSRNGFDFFIKFENYFLYTYIFTYFLNVYIERFFGMLCLTVLFVFKILHFFFDRYLHQHL